MKFSISALKACLSRTHEVLCLVEVTIGHRCAYIGIIHVIVHFDGHIEKLSCLGIVLRLVGGETAIKDANGVLVVALLQILAVFRYGCWIILRFQIRPWLGLNQECTIE